MSRIFIASGLLALITTANGLAVDKPVASCGAFGTAVQFVATPSDAARQARQEQKLVFVLHVSGHFEDPRFT